MSLHRLLFDVAAPDDSANVGAYLRSSDGTLLTHSTVGGSEALDVNLVQSVTLTVQATDLDIRNLVFATDKVDVSGSEVSLDSATLAALESITVQNGAGGAAVNIQDGGNSITVDAVDLDIRNLVFATDKVDVSGSSVSVTGDVNVTQGTSPWVVSATDLDIRDLAAATDSVSAWVKDGSGNAIGSTSGALNVNIANAADIQVELTHNTAVTAEAETVTTTEANLVATPLANRENMWIYNNGSKPVYIGQTGVTAASGFPIFPGSILEMALGPAVVLRAIAASGSQDVRVMQAS